MLASIGRVCYRHRRLVLAGWLLLAVTGFLVGGRVFDRLERSEGAPAHESVRGAELLDQISPHGDRLVVLVDGVPVADRATSAAVTGAADTVRTLPEVSRVRTAYDRGQAGLRAADGRTSAVLVDLAKSLEDEQEDRAVDAVRARFDEVERAVPGARVRYGGEPLVQRESAEQVKRDTRRGELIALPISLAVLVLVFGGFLAAGVPVAGTLVAIAGALLALLGFSHVIKLNPNVVTVATVLSFGLAIDYGLLLVSRFREERAQGVDVPAAIERTVATAGRTVTFSGLILVTSLAGLFVFQSPFYRAVGAAGMSVVAVSLLATLTLSPALLGVLGRRVHSPGRRGIHGLFFARVARGVHRRPVVISVAVGVLLVGFGIPFLRVDLQNGDAGLLPPSFESRQVADVLAEQLPDLGGEPVYVVARADADRLESYAVSISARPEVRRAEVVPGRDGLASVEVLPRAEGEDQEVRDLVRALRAEETGFQTWVTGDAAALVDFTDEIERRMPFAGGFIAAATMLLLFLMTGSVLIPIKALAMNTLSLGASFGALVLVFQDGHLAEYLDVSPPGAVETWIPVLVFVFAFGLSMDYEVFLLARIKEMHDAGHPNDRAVELGLQYSGRIITAAAVLVIIVFAGFAAGEMLSIKELGLALALAVLIDATLVRCLLVPATMTLLGEANWWAPRPLRWLHGKLGLRESATVPVGSAAWPPPRPDTPFPPPRTAAGPAAGSTTEAASDPATESATGPRPRRLPRPLPGSAAERITAALADALAAGEIGNGGMPDRWVLIATTIDINGEIRPVPLASPGAHLHEILGLLDLGRVAWRENAHQRMWRDGKAH